jgi:hypothetical protein
MRTLFFSAACLISALLGGVAEAADEQTARSLCAAVEQQSPLPPSLQSKILLGQRGDPGTWLFSIGTVATADEAEALHAFASRLAPCRQAMLQYLSGTPSGQARSRLFANNDRILSDLAAQRISFGEANRRWDMAQAEFEGLADARRVTPVAYAGGGQVYGSGISCGGSYSARC